VELRRRQYDRADDPRFCLDFATRIVRGKIANQLYLMNRINRNAKLPPEAGNLRKLAARAGLATSIPSLLGIEGAASATYFRMFGRWLPSPFDFKKRVSNPPTDETNALLSLAYTLLYNRVRSNLEVVGLDAYLGFMHQPKNGHAALASDLVEEFRPLFADALVLKLLRRRQIVLEHFDRSSGRIRLNDDGSRIFFGEFEEKMASKRQTDAGDGWQMSYAQIIERQARHVARVIGDSEGEYVPFSVK
jgi:CRISPR-associated protein Cas1